MDDLGGADRHLSLVDQRADAVLEQIALDGAVVNEGAYILHLVPVPVAKVQVCLDGAPVNENGGVHSPVPLVKPVLHLALSGDRYPFGDQNGDIAACLCPDGDGHVLVNHDGLGVPVLQGSLVLGPVFHVDCILKQAILPQHQEAALAACLAIGLTAHYGGAPLSHQQVALMLQPHQGPALQHAGGAHRDSPAIGGAQQSLVADRAVDEQRPIPLYGDGLLYRHIGPLGHL